MLLDQSLTLAMWSCVYTCVVRTCVFDLVELGNAKLAPVSCCMPVCTLHAHLLPEDSV
jgi:hypothetical protein